MKMNKLVPKEIVESYILFLRNQKVIVDADLARLYGVTTKVINQAVKRNHDRFPDDFVFQLTSEEKNELVTNCDRFERLKHSSSLPFAFTEHGAVMAANLLNSPIAIQARIQVVRVFVRLREIISTHKELSRKFEELEKKYDYQFKIVFDAIRDLMKPVDKPKRQIGFRVEEPRIGYRV